MSISRTTLRQRRAVTSWVLVIGVLLQPLLTYLVTPWLAEDARGHVVFMCTLKGLKAVQVENDRFDPDTENQEETCPALTLVQLAATARIATPLAIWSAPLYVVELVDITRDDQFQTQHFSFYSSRAPPLV